MRKQNGYIGIEAQPQRNENEMRYHFTPIRLGEVKMSENPVFKQQELPCVLEEI